MKHRGIMRGVSAGRGKIKADSTVKYQQQVAKKKAALATQAKSK